MNICEVFQSEPHHFDPHTIFNCHPFSSHRLTELPHNIGDWLNLRTLSLGHNKLQQLPSSFTGLVSLDTLDLRANQIRQLPPGLQHLSKLVLLHVQSNELLTVPPGLTCLTGLTDLDLSRNKLRPGGLDCGLLVALTGLESLRLADNPQLFDWNGFVSGSLGQRAAASAASAQRLQAWMAAWIEGSISRQQAAAAASGRTDAGRSIGAGGAAGGSGAARSASAGAAASGQLLPQLKCLEVSGTGLYMVPSWLPAGLQELRAARNPQITELPPWLCARLSGSLKTLDLRGTMIYKVPREITNLIQLQLLALQGCPCASPEFSTNSSSESSSRGSGGGVSAGGGASLQLELIEGSAAWAGGWLMARKAGRQWPPGPSMRKLPPALLAAAGVPVTNSQVTNQGSRLTSAGPYLDSGKGWEASQGVKQEEQSKGAAGVGEAGAVGVPAFGGGRRRAAMIVIPSADESA